MMRARFARIAQPYAQTIVWGGAALGCAGFWAGLVSLVAVAFSG